MAERNGWVLVAARRGHVELLREIFTCMVGTFEELGQGVGDATTVEGRAVCRRFLARLEDALCRLADGRPVGDCLTPGLSREFLALFDPRRNQVEATRVAQASLVELRQGKEAAEAGKAGLVAVYKDLRKRLDKYERLFEDNPYRLDDPEAPDAA